MGTYISLSLLKEELGITDTDRDNLLDQAIDAAEYAIDTRAGRTGRAPGGAFGQDASASARQYRTVGRVNRDDAGAPALLVDDIATDTDLMVESGSNGSWSTVDAGDYELEPDNAFTLGRPVTRIRRTSGAWSTRVRVTAVWGWPQIPEDIIRAALLQAGRLYRRKDSPEGVTGSADWGLIRLPHLDPDVRKLVEPYRIPGVV